MKPFHPAPGDTLHSYAYNDTEISCEDRDPRQVFYLLKIHAKMKNTLSNPADHLRVPVLQQHLVVRSIPPGNSR